MDRYETIAQSAELKALNEYWTNLRADRRMPSRADFVPEDLPASLLPNMLLIEVSHDPLRFYYRVMGTGIATLLGEDWTGKYVDQIKGVNKNVLQQYVDTVTTAAPSIYSNQYQKFDKTVGYKRLLNYERLLLPLSYDDTTVHHLLGATLVKPVDGEATN
jgi:hypothetical protein